MPLPEDKLRRQRIIAGLRGRSLEQAVADPALREDMRAEAHSADPDKLVPLDLVQLADTAGAMRAREPNLGLFFDTDDVILIPGFLGSELVDVAGTDGLIWIDPKLVFDTSKLLDLGLAKFNPESIETDSAAGITVRPHGAIPVLYSGLHFDLEVRRYHVDIFGFDWRKNLEESAANLANVIRDRANRRFRPLHLIAHSQGSLVARRALQLVGIDLARQLVQTLVLLGPATAGSFAAAFAIAGTNDTLETLRRYGIEPPPGFTAALQSMTGLYQLLPWRTTPAKRLTDPSTNGNGQATQDPALNWIQHNREHFRTPAFWQTGVDADRLGRFYGWGDRILAGFFNDRTTIILGDSPTVGGVKFENGRLVPDHAFAAPGDGTVPDSLALIEGVTRIYRAPGVTHMMLPANLTVIAAVHDLLAGRQPRLEAPTLGARAETGREIPRLAAAPPPPSIEAQLAPPAKPPSLIPPKPHVGGRTEVPAPPTRRLRVFSFDPLLGTDLDALGTEQITLQLPWDFADGDHLQPGPVGEYLEVVDHDPATQCFYPPVDLNHPHLLAQDGLPLSEGDPRFHQQMAYAVAMNTIRHFEVALGRSALWAPHLERDSHGEVIRGRRPEDEFVRRLRIYPHALRQANAYYDPQKQALLLGYFPAQGADVGRNLPGGTVFACLSYDIVAHETTHALVDGLHRYFTEPSNPDVFAFHEALADVVALFQHFTHPEVLRYQLGKAHGDLTAENLLGVLAAQFGEATGHRGALRQYLGRRNAQGKWEAIPPDPKAITQTWEPHDRGAILVAAMFRAFANIYENRVKDLRRIATRGTGILPNGDLQPDLVGRLADEAAKSAQHLLTMSIRALDYIPPVDLTFGEYLRALITADYDLVRDDDRRYRVSLLAGFRDWGIYPRDVRSLSIDGLLWSSPEADALRHVDKFLRQRRLDGWDLHTDRRLAYVQMRQLSMEFHDWLSDEKNLPLGREWSLGLCLDPDKAPKSIRRGADGKSVFEVHSFRPYRRIGPDGQQRTDVVVELVQRRKAFYDPIQQKAVDSGKERFETAQQDFYFRGGCTLIIDPITGDIRYCIRKSITMPSDSRLDQERRFRQGQFGDKVGGAYLAPERDQMANPFAFLHSGR